MAAEPSYKIFIRGIALTVDENELELAFAKYGRIMEVLLLRDKETKASRGIGFLTFECTEDCDDAVRGMNGQELKGSTLQVEIATEKPGYQKHTRGRGFNRGNRGASRGMNPWADRGRVPGRGGRPYRRGPPNLNPINQGQATASSGYRGMVYEQGRFSRPTGRRPYGVPEAHREYAPYAVAQEEYTEEEYTEEEYTDAEVIPQYNSAYAAEDPTSPEDDYGHVAPRSNEFSTRRQEKGYLLDSTPTRQVNPTRQTREYESYSVRGQDAGYGLVDPRTLESGYPPPAEASTGRRGQGHEHQRAYADPEPPADNWNRDYGDHNYRDRKFESTDGGFSLADWEREEALKNLDVGYGVRDASGGSRLQGSDRTYTSSAASVPHTQNEYAQQMNSRLQMERGYGTREVEQPRSAYNVTTSKRGYSGNDAQDYGYGPVDPQEASLTSTLTGMDMGYGTVNPGYRESWPPSGRSEMKDIDERGGNSRSHGLLDHESSYRGGYFSRTESGQRNADGSDPRRNPGPQYSNQGDQLYYEGRRDDRNIGLLSRGGYSDEQKVSSSKEYNYSDPAYERTQRRPYGGYGSAQSSHSQSFSGGGRPVRGSRRGARGNESGLRHQHPRPDDDEPKAKRRSEIYHPEQQRNYSASRGRAPRRGGRRGGGR